MKNQLEIFKYLIKGHTLVHTSGKIAFFKSDGKLNEDFYFDDPENWRIQPSIINRGAS